MCSFVFVVESIKPSDRILTNAFFSRTIIYNSVLTLIAVREIPRLLTATEFLSAQQISSFFFRLAAKASQKEVQVKEQDARAVEEEVNFSTDRDGVISSLHVAYSIVVDQCDLCALV